MQRGATRSRHGARSVLLACVVVALLAGCGAGESSPRPTTHAAATRTQRPPVSGCMPTVATAIAAVVPGAQVRSAPTTASPGIRGCRYAAGHATVATVTIDSNPQAFKRWFREVVETDQTGVWSDDSPMRPRKLDGLGKGADWFPGDALLLSSDGPHLVRVEVAVRHYAERIARVVTRATLQALAAGH